MRTRSITSYVSSWRRPVSRVNIRSSGATLLMTSMSATSSAPKLLAKAIWEPNVSAAQRTISSADLPVSRSFAALTFSGLSAVAVTSLVTWWYLLGISLALSCTLAGLQRALSLAADDLEELFLAPPDVDVDLLTDR